MKAFTLQPRDLLFFRDARPMSGASEGAGARWPLPSVLHSALLSAFHDRWPEDPGWESRHTHFTPEEQEKFQNGIGSTMRFGGLRTLGPFPWRCSHSTDPSGDSGELFFPTPADLVCGGRMQPVPAPGTGNLPEPLRYPVAADAPPAKEKPDPWISLTEFQKYLETEAEDIATTPAEDLYAVEPRPGVGIDPETHANRKSVFFQAEYLRLRENVQMLFFAEAIARKYGQTDGIDLLERFLDNAQTAPIILGGQRGLAAIRPAPAMKTLPLPPPPGQGATRIKWVLLTPALFNAGWRPDWVHSETGRVLLRELPDRSRFPTRKAWREAARERAAPIGAALVAARIPKPIPASGWKLDVAGAQPGGPKPTRLLVPAGAVYYFECDEPAAAASLVRALHGKVKSSHLGEKGFGLGVCGTWSLKKTTP